MYFSEGGIGFSGVAKTQIDEDKKPYIITNFIDY